MITYIDTGVLYTDWEYACVVMVSTRYGDGHFLIEGSYVSSRMVGGYGEECGTAHGNGYGTGLDFARELAA